MGIVRKNFDSSTNPFWPTGTIDSIASKSGHHIIVLKLVDNFLPHPLQSNPRGNDKRKKKLVVKSKSNFPVNNKQVMLFCSHY